MLLVFYAILSVLYTRSLAIISPAKKSWLLCFICLSDDLVADSAMYLFLVVPCVGLQCVIVVLITGHVR